MVRTVEEWIGKSDDQRAPGRVRDRILSNHPNCHLCGRQIVAGEKWDLDHVRALINGGENRESNLRPAHLKCHKEKTARDVAEKAAVARKRLKHMGITKPKQKIKSPGFAKAERKHEGRPTLPPRPMFRNTGE